MTEQTKPKFVLIVEWPNNRVERLPIPETVPVHVGHGEESPARPIFCDYAGCAGGRVNTAASVGSVIFHGERPLSWCAVPWVREIDDHA
jgi:hypothetical protein